MILPAATCRSGRRSAPASTARWFASLSLALTLLVWEWYGRGVDPVFMSYPTAIVEAVPAMIASGELPRALLSSLTGLAVGLALSIVFGTLVGLLMGRYRLVDQILDLQINALYATPNVALIPLLILWFGLGLLSKIVIIFLAGFFPIIVNTYAGVRNVSRGLVEVALAEGGNEARSSPRSSFRRRCRSSPPASASPWAAPWWRWWWPSCSPRCRASAAPS